MVEGLFQNILSVKKPTKNKYNVIFTQENAKIADGEVTWYCTLDNGLYILEGKIYQEEAYTSSKENNETWHTRLGHLNRKGLAMVKLPISKETCDVCMKGKATRQPLKSVKKLKSKAIGKLIHTDITGPIIPTSRSEYKYFQTIMDDYSHFVETYLMKNKSEAEYNLRNYIRESKKNKR